MTRTTDFPSWFWLPLRDDCEWDSIFSMHECYDEEYDNVLSTLIGVLLRIFLTTPFFFWAFMVFHFSRQFSQRLLLLILALTIITAVPVWLLPTIYSDGYERHRGMVEPSFSIMREIWMLLALPNIFFCPAIVTLWLRQSIAMMQEAIVGMGDYVSNGFDFDISFPVSQGRDLTPRNDEVSGAERWMRLLLQEVEDDRQAKRDEEARVLEQENNAKQAALLKKQESDWMLDVASKAFTLRSQRQRRQQRVRRDPPPPQGEGYNPRRALAAALKLQDEGINIPVYKTKSTQTEEADFVARRKTTKPTSPPPRKYVSCGVQTEPVESLTCEEPKVTTLTVLPVLPVTPQEVLKSTTTTSPVEEKPVTPVQEELNSINTDAIAIAITNTLADATVPTSPIREEPNGVTNTTITVTNTLPDTTIPASPIREEPDSLSDIGRLSPSSPASHAPLKQEEPQDLSNADSPSPPVTVFSPLDEPNDHINIDIPPISPSANLFPGQEEPNGLINTNCPSLSPIANRESSADVDVALDDIIQGYAQLHIGGEEFEDDIYEDSLAGDHDMPDEEPNGSAVSQESHNQTPVACDTDEEMVDQVFFGPEEPAVKVQQEDVEDQEVSVNDIEMAETPVRYPTQEEKERIEDAALDVFGEFMDEDDDEASERSEPRSNADFRMRDRSRSPPIEHPRPIQTPPIQFPCSSFSISEEPTESATATLGIQFPPYDFTVPPPLPATAQPGTQFQAFRFPQTLHAGQDVQVQAPVTEGSPSQYHTMSQNEQDELARLMEAEFEMHNAQGTNTQTVQDSQSQPTQSPRLNSHPSIPIDPELAIENQALLDAANAPTPLPTSQYDSYTSLRDEADKKRDAPDPAKVATKEKLATRRIAKPRTRRTALTPAQENFPQSSVPSGSPQQQQQEQHPATQQQPAPQLEHVQANDIAVMDTEALNILRLAMENDIPIPGHTQTQEAGVQEEPVHGEVSQENQSHENTANESTATEQPEVVQPVTPEVPPQQTETHGTPYQPAPSQQQTPATTTPLPQTPQTPQHTSKAPLSEEEKQKRKIEQVERAKRAREARKKAGPSIFHQPKRGGTPGPSTPRTPRTPTTPTTPRQDLAGSQAESADAEVEGIKILAAGDIPMHLRDQVHHHKN
ncbi:hypothetical protein DER45DRAFT_536436 [Fusarium avenaceum]|nr:hypothetical protein DER45DRAFT_536436 [Fusarium avenaceum]